MKNIARRTPLVLGAAMVIGIGASSIAGATGEGTQVKIGQRNPVAGAAAKETQIIANTALNSYGTRQSNLGKGGGAIYGCRAGLGANPADPKITTACIRVNNLADGEAFQFQSNIGSVIGVFQSGGNFAVPNPKAAPFITNATGLATGLNADKLDGRDAEQIIAEARAGNPAAAAPSFAFGQVGATGTVEASRSQGVAQDQVTHPAPGVYCFNGLASRPKNAQATLVGVPGEIAADTLGDNAACPGNEQLSVLTFSSAGAPEDKPFQIALTGGGA
jgi:hypothetical protein